MIHNTASINRKDLPIAFWLAHYTAWVVPKTRKHRVVSLMLTRHFQNQGRQFTQQKSSSHYTKYQNCPVAPQRERTGFFSVPF